MIGPVPRDCPCCEGKTRIPKFHQTFFGGPLGEGYTVVICADCGFVFADDLPSEDEFEKYYTWQSKYTYPERNGLESIYDFRRFNVICDQISPYLKSSSTRILDIGCATGGLLKCWVDRGMKNVLGLDPSTRCAELAQELHGIKVLSVQPSDLISSRERFDLITMVGVLEHVYQPQKLLDDARLLLSAEGIIYAGQPNLDTFHQCSNAPFQQFSTEHINFFTPRSLEVLMARSGFARLCFWQWMVEWREGITDSMVSGVFGKNCAIGVTFEYDRNAESALDRYLAVCREEEAKIIGLIEILIGTREPLVIWGVGTLTRRLLASSRFGLMNIICFIDNDVRWKGIKIVDRPVLLPSEVHPSGRRILISSKANQNEIVEEIGKRYGESQPFLKLYE